jgi:murein DD-endopeptidase MepM/ murein hydrolase activator NlpD
LRRFGWIRLACLFLALTVLTALVRLGDTGAEARSLAARVPDVISLTPEEPQGSEPEVPAVTRWTEAQISSLQDVSEDALRAQDASRPAAPRIRDETERVPPAGRKGRAAPPSEPPVFYRPASPGEPAGSGPVCGDLRGAPEGGRIVFPLQRQFFFSYDDTWGAPRTQGGHEGTDLMTPSGVPEYAITDGTVVPVAGSNADGWNTLGGHAVMVRADYSIGP